MNAESEVPTAPSINGHVIMLGAGHSIAVYERDREHYVAEFRDGCGELAYAAAWFRQHAGSLRYRGGNRAGFQCSMPLTAQMLQQIERLHAESEAREAKLLALPHAFAAAAGRCWSRVMARPRRRPAKLNQTVG